MPTDRHTEEQTGSVRCDAMELHGLVNLGCSSVITLAFLWTARPSPVAGSVGWPFRSTAARSLRAGGHRAMGNLATRTSCMLCKHTASRRALFSFGQLSGARRHPGALTKLVPRSCAALRCPLSILWRRLLERAGRRVNWTRILGTHADIIRFKQLTPPYVCMQHKVLAIFFLIGRCGTSTSSI